MASKIKYTKDELNHMRREILCIQPEICRILNVTLQGTFRNDADRRFWEDRAKTLTGRLQSLQDAVNPGREMFQLRKTR